MADDRATLTETLKTLFNETQAAHHAAHIETDGFHPDWPTWYAEHLHTRLRELLGANFTVSELIYLLVLVHKEHALRAPGAEWAGYYTRFFIERYL